MTTIYNTWISPCGVNVTEIDHDYDLHAFRVEYEGATAEVVPHNIAEMEQAIRDLNACYCPVFDGWEDGNGRLVRDIIGEQLGRTL